MTEERTPESPEPEPAPSARLTPYELVFLEGEFESRHFPRIDEEAEEQGIGTADPERFDFLTTTADLVRDVTPAEAPPEALEQYRALLFQAYHFWGSGRNVFAFDRASSRFLVETAPSLAGWEYNPPAESGYVQLAQNLFWGSIDLGSPPEPIDGFFFVESEIAGPDGTPERRLHLLFVLGIYRARAGFSVIRLETGIEPDLAEALDASEREGGDFANTLPGGEISGLYSILTGTEALKLAARAFWYLDRFPEATTLIESPGPRVRDSDPPPTHLAYSSVTLQSNGAEGDGG